jgi:hypothetical protein
MWGFLGAKCVVVWEQNVCLFVIFGCGVARVVVLLLAALRENWQYGSQLIFCEHSEQSGTDRQPDRQTR